MSISDSRDHFFRVLCCGVNFRSYFGSEGEGVITVAGGFCDLEVIGVKETTVANF